MASSLYSRQRWWPSVSLPGRLSPTSRKGACACGQQRERPAGKRPPRSSGETTCHAVPATPHWQPGMALGTSHRINGHAKRRSGSKPWRTRRQADERHQGSSRCSQSWVPVELYPPRNPTEPHPGEPAVGRHQVCLLPDKVPLAAQRYWAGLTCDDNLELPRIEGLASWSMFGRYGRRDGRIATAYYQLRSGVLVVDLSDLAMPPSWHVAGVPWK